MREVVKHVASIESVKLPKDKETGPIKAAIISGDPITSFETYHWSVVTDLKAWMTYDVKARKEKASLYARKTPDEAQRSKILNFIIWQESHHPNGHSHVAAIAFRGLFPNHKADAS